ncbi:peptidoglycan DD-metalloendopeptidase family protein [Odoribacter sp. OttesenSCG-928-J03]|nr:peptidoglycan DD-metalloendopeptidase family protein [Odoribacter sp. OttesenSCG-928-J03]MDL2283181.1 peptidoglycan DD-metalloendopeptidase family protein [Odoribacter sp. OttesenSCG-928-G04]MDL2331128.1 peptidoglycan DD-metalloendopeptidase family protein [Odoribacter sp. OttesenSCG-928-A06]
MTKKKQILFSSILGIILLIVIFIPKHSGVAENLDEVDITETEEIEEIVYKYGIPMNDYEVDYGVVKRNQSLSTILISHGLNMNQVHRLSAKSKDVFNVKKIRSGNAYAFFSRNDSLRTPEYFVYEIDQKSYVVYDLRDDFNVTLGYHPVEWVQKTAKGTVESSLWNAMKACSAEPFLAIELARIFGWTIDFFGLQKEDEFRVLYEQESVDGKDLVHLNITGAKFVNGKQAYYAIPFKQDGEILYYNENGNSLEGAFLKSPMDYFRITSRFTNSRYHPVLKKYRAHHGVDYAAPVGTPVYAIGDGTVTAKGFQAGGGGNYVKIKHNSTYTSTYMHLSRFPKGLKVGSKVKQKEVIGYVGSTGLSTGPHLDFRVSENGKPVDPLKIKSQPKKPISEANMPEFTVVRDSIINLLNTL